MRASNWTTSSVAGAGSAARAGSQRDARARKQRAANVSVTPVPSTPRSDVERDLAHRAGAGHLAMGLQVVAQARIIGGGRRAAGVGQHADFGRRRARQRNGERRRGAATIGSSASSARASRDWKAALGVNARSALRRESPIK
ncbi:hypothetical protein G6F22_019253 [Rhizopus arrhizus]|nr:hypothetical protein G6F22_019253 [Rhizopus arrhizus]